MNTSRTRHRAASPGLPRVLLGGTALLLTGTGLWVAHGQRTGADRSTGAGASTDRPVLDHPEPADRSLLSFTCATGPDDVWNATGTLVNSVQRRAEYVVTARVVDDAGETLAERTTRIALDGRESTAVRLPAVYSGAAGTTCLSEVLRTGDPLR